MIDLYGHIKEFVGSPLEPEFAAAKAGDIPRSCLDPTAAKEFLGWEPWTPLETGLRRTVDWFRANPDW